jgi:hypothetical protein
MISDLNFYPTDKENYATEQLSGDSFLAGIFLTYDQINSYPYPVVYSNNIIYQQSNPAVPPYNCFGGSSSTFGCNLANDLGRSKEQSNIDDSSSVDLTVMELSDDHDDQDDGDPYYWSEVETWEDYIEQSDISIGEFEDEEIQRCDTTLLITGRTKRQHIVEALNNFEILDHLGANESQLGPDDELAENKIFASKLSLSWIICDWSVRKNVQCWVQ